MNKIQTFTFLLAGFILVILSGCMHTVVTDVRLEDGAMRQEKCTLGVWYTAFSTLTGCRYETVQKL